MLIFAEEKPNSPSANSLCQLRHLQNSYFAVYVIEVLPHQLISMIALKSPNPPPAYVEDSGFSV